MPRFKEQVDQQKLLHFRGSFARGETSLRSFFSYALEDLKEHEAVLAPAITTSARRKDCVQRKWRRDH